MFCGGHVDSNDARFQMFTIAGGEYSELVDVTTATVVSDYQPAAAYEGCDSTAAKLLGNDTVI